MEIRKNTDFYIFSKKKQKTFSFLYYVIYIYNGDPNITQRRSWYAWSSRDITPVVKFKIYKINSKEYEICEYANMYVDMAKNLNNLHHLNVGKWEVMEVYFIISPQNI